MIYNMIYIFLIIIIIIILFNVINNLNKKKKIEYFEASSSTWSTSSDDVKKENEGLTSNQLTQVKNISSKTCTDTLTSLVQTQSPLLAGPPGPIGPPGPAGTTLVASGKLVNKKISFNQNDKNKINPQLVVGRSEGTNPSSSLSYMDNISPFASYQDWQLDINSNIKNRFDNTCMTMSKTDNKIYMDTCDPNNANQKWNWDNTNRLYSTSNSTKTILKCISTKEMDNIHITSVPGCKPGDKNCVKTGKQNFLVVDDCKVNDIQDNQLWGFI
jgi:hypothetical protein